MHQTIHAILFDLDGVLYIGEEMIPGADRVIRELRRWKIPLAGVTNTTTSSRRAIAAKLQRMGIDLAERELFTPAALAVRQIGRRPARLYIRDALREDFASVTQSCQQPEIVVMGDIGGEGYPPETLREIFLHLINDNAELLALHHNRFWQKPDGLHLDLGVFVAAMEYASGRQARVVGKPSPDFFHGVCQALDVAPSNALMVGDDIESDILGAHRAGLQTALVHTGKYRAAFVAQIAREQQFQPDQALGSVSDLLRLFES